MSTSSSIKEITILRTWKGEEFTLDMKYEDFLIYEENQKKMGFDSFPLKDYRRILKFSSIEDRIGRTLHLALPESKPQKILYSEEDKIKSRKLHQKILKQIEPKIKKNFLEKRQEILKRLSYEEKRFGLETTLFKLEELEGFKKQQIKNNNL